MAIGNFPSIQSVLANRIGFAIQNMRENLIENDSIASRVLLQSIKFNISIFGAKIEANILMEDYWKNVDEGQKPGHRPNLQKIIKWTVDKGLDISPRKSKLATQRRGIKRKATSFSTTKNRENVAKRIVEKIYKVGTKPTYFASDVINPEWMQRVGKQLEISGAKDIVFRLNVPKETRI